VVQAGAVKDIRLDIVKVGGHWGVTDSRTPLRYFSHQDEAVADATALANAHRRATGGRATVHLWRDQAEILLFDTNASA
jgi:hypothetical protein